MVAHSFCSCGTPKRPRANSCRSCWQERVRKRAIRGFWASVDKDGPVQPHCSWLGPCWVWTGRFYTNGYGTSSALGKQDGAHRTAWLLAHGEIPAGLWVLHHCDNKSCVLIDHLFLGTVVDNNRDMATKGRSALGERNGNTTHPERRAVGERHGMARLRESDVIEIRGLLAQGTSRMRLAERFGVSYVTIADIATRRFWRHLPDLPRQPEMDFRVLEGAPEVRMPVETEKTVRGA